VGDNKKDNKKKKDPDELDKLLDAWKKEIESEPFPGSDD
jgi:hypothetical protein